MRWVPVVSCMEAITESDAEQVRNVCHSGDISDTVVTAVATATGTDPLELDPLYTVVDPDALDGMFQPSIGAPPTDLEVRFSMAGCQVTVHADGEVAVTPPSSTDGTPTIDEPHTA